MPDQPSRKPPGAMEAREEFPTPQTSVTYPVRLKPALIERIKLAALRAGLGHTTFARECLIRGLIQFEVERAVKESTRVTA